MQHSAVEKKHLTRHVTNKKLSIFQGDLQAQVGLGQLYFQGGRGIDVNYEKAFKYFQLAGDVENGNGLAYLGKMYLEVCCSLLVEDDKILSGQHLTADKTLGIVLYFRLSFLSKFFPIRCSIIFETKSEFSVWWGRNWNWGKY